MTDFDHNAHPRRNLPTPRRLRINERLLQYVEHLVQPAWHIAQRRLCSEAPRFAQVLAAGGGRDLQAMQRALEIAWRLSNDDERRAFRQALRLAQQVDQSARRIRHYRAAQRPSPTPPASTNHPTNGAKI